MGDHLDGLFEEIREEREYQDSKWGTEFDNKNTVNDWVAYIAQYSGYAIKMGNSTVEQRRHMLKVATLAVAALEAFDRNEGFPPRHYD